MHNNLYSPLYDYILETWDEITESSLHDAIIESLESFFPEIKTKFISFDFNEGNKLLHIKISYEIINLKTENNIEISLPIES